MVVQPLFIEMGQWRSMSPKGLLAQEVSEVILASLPKTVSFPV